jgi:hypothetical protein
MKGRAERIDARGTTLVGPPKADPLRFGRNHALPG